MSISTARQTRCEKWILQKNLHRYSDSKIFSTLIENIFLGKWKIISRKCVKYHYRKLLSMKNRNPYQITHFHKNNFNFQKKTIQKKWENLRITISILYWCKNFWRIHFSNPFCRLSSVRCSKLTLELKIMVSRMKFTTYHLKIFFKKLKIHFKMKFLHELFFCFRFGEGSAKTRRYIRA